MNLTKNFKKSLEWKGRILEIEHENVWGTSVIKDENGKYHAFYATWDDKSPRQAWIINCKVMHAVADKITGPYKTIGTALKGTGGHEWDSWTIHNPLVQKIGNEYVMTYMGNSGETINQTSKEVCDIINKVTKAGQFGQFKHQQEKGNIDPKIAAKAFDSYIKLVGQKRIGIAVTKDLNKPFQRISKYPRISLGENTTWDDFAVSNPSMIQMYDGRFALFYKAWDHISNENGGNRKYGVAFANTFKGPYEKYEKNPIIDYSPVNAQLEDLSFFKLNNKYYAVGRDMGIKDHIRGIIMESNDCIKWSKPKDAYGPVSEYVEEKFLGLKPREGNFERPFVYFEDNKPAYLIASARGGKYPTSSAAIWKINQDKLK